MKNLKKIIIVSLLLLTWVIFQTQLFSYSWELIWDKKCSEINDATRYSNLSPTIIEKIDLIWDRINEKYELKDDIYKEKLYNLFEKVLNEHLQKTTYSEVQKEVLLRIWDYFVCKKEGLENYAAIKESAAIKLYSQSWPNRTIKEWETVYFDSKSCRWDIVEYIWKEWNTVLSKLNNFTKNDFSIGKHIIELTVIDKYWNTDADKLELIVEELENRDSWINNDYIISENNWEWLTSIYSKDIGKKPIYDSWNPDHVLINSNSDWNKINGAAHYYFINPNDYSGAGNINITSSGNSSNRRYIILNDKYDIHPAKLLETERAIVRLHFNWASFWIVDRMASTWGPNTDWYEPLLFYNGATDNIVNKLYVYNMYRGITIRHLSHRNTIQNSRFENQTLQGRKDDRVGGIALAGKARNQDGTVYDTIICDNEIKNTLDGIQLIWRNWVTRIYDGTIIDNNLIWVDSDIYTNKVGGTDGVGWDYSYSEDAIDIKRASINPDKPLIISNNKMWGFRKCANDGDPGTWISLTSYSQNTKIYNNIIFDSFRSLQSHAWSPNLEFKNNIVYDTDKVPFDYNATSFFVYNSVNFQIDNNTFVSNNDNVSVQFETNTGVPYFRKNLFVNNVIANRHSNSSLNASDNYFYDTPNWIKGVGDVNVSSTSEAKMSDYSFQYDIFTNSPKQKTLYWVVSTKDSPHYGKAGSNIK